MVSCDDPILGYALKNGRVDTVLNHNKNYSYLDSIQKSHRLRVQLFS